MLEIPEGRTASEHTKYKNDKRQSPKPQNWARAEREMVLNELVCHLRTSAFWHLYLFAVQPIAG